MRSMGLRSRVRGNVEFRIVDHQLGHSHGAVPKFRPVGKMQLFVLFSFSGELFAAVGLSRDGVEYAVGIGDSCEWKLQMTEANLGGAGDVPSMNSP